MEIFKEIYNLLPVKFTKELVEIELIKTNYLPLKCCYPFLIYCDLFNLINESNKNIFTKRNKRINIDIIFDKIEKIINEMPKGLYKTCDIREYLHGKDLIDNDWNKSTTIECLFSYIYEYSIKEDEYLKQNHYREYQWEYYEFNNNIIKELATNDFIKKYNEIKLKNKIQNNSFYNTKNNMNFIINNVNLNSELGKLIISIINEHKTIENKYVYLMHDVNGNSYKFGQTYDLIYREKTLRAKEPKIELVKFCQTNVITESDLKEKYKSKRGRGEWFDLSDDEVNEVKDLMNCFCEINIQNDTTL